MRKIREKLSGRPLRQPQPPKGTPAVSSVAPPQPSRPPHQAPPPPPAPVLTISPAALATLTWAAQRSENECCLWGVLGATDEGNLRLEEVVLARHRAAPAWCAPDMEWYGDLLAELHAQRALEPWQLACWIHTHPPGLAAPSLLDRATFAASFGRQRLALMLIVTRDLRLYGEISTFAPPLPGLAPARLSAPLKLAFAGPAAPLAAAEREELERQYLERAQFSQRGPAAWPWEAPSELWPSGDPDFNPEDEPYLPSSWVEAWRQARLDLPESALEDYLRGYLVRSEESQGCLDPAAFDLELIAIFFDEDTMSIWAAALLRERLRALAARRGWS